MRRFLPIALFAALFGIAAYFWGCSSRNHLNGTEVVQVVPDGTDTATGSSVVIMRDNHRHFFFSGYFFIPLFFFLIFLIAHQS
jgi:hypothetical protein